jgi:hypothetical protein
MTLGPDESEPDDSAVEQTGAGPDDKMIVDRPIHLWMAPEQ